MSQAPFIIYKSSAGSGKTYTLTTEYLKIALRHPLAFRQILAVTFTNKATQEMKSRILKEIKRIKTAVDVRHTMDRELLEIFGGDEKLLSQRANETLSAILHDYSSFSVNTIDSFFQRVIRAFAREIDLQAKFDIEMDQDAVMERLVERLMLKVMEDPHLHQWMVDFASENIMEGKSWDIRREIGLLGKNIFQEDFKKHEKEVQYFLEDQENILKLRQHLTQQKKEIAKQAKEIKVRANAIREALGLEWEDFKGGSNSFVKVFEKLGDQKSPVPQLSDPQKTYIDQPEIWYSKASKKKESITQSFVGLNGYLLQIETLSRLWITLNAIHKNFYVFGLFSYLIRELAALKEEENILLISDANDFLKEITAGNDAPFVYEKVGNQYQYFLLDEFQDTSGFQWASFRPLLINSLSQGNTNLLVGDVKQSIYRWRGGEMRLLMEQVERENSQFGLEVKKLDTNYRSLPNIVEFNNAFFSTLPSLVLESLERDHGLDDSPKTILKAFAEVVQSVAPHNRGMAAKGMVRMEWLEPQKNEKGQKELNFKEQVLEKLPKMLRELQEQGYYLKDIAILVRNNLQGAEVADALMAYQKQHPLDPFRYEVLSDEAMFLDRAASVKCLLAALQYLNDQDNQLASNVMWAQWARVFGHEVDHGLFNKSTFPQQFLLLEKKLIDMKPVLLKLPLMDLLEALIEIMGLNGDHEEKAYLSGFKEGIYDFMVKNRADLGSFLSWWDQNGAKRTVKLPESHNAIRILTIHKSKGLQFKVVLAPYLDWKVFDTSKDNIVWAPYFWQEREQETIIPLTLRKELKDSAFAPVYREEQMLANLDNLNLLYVAFTRAEEVFWGLAPFVEAGKNNKMGTVSEWLSAVFFNMGINVPGFSFEDHMDSEKKVFEYGDLEKVVVTKEEMVKKQELRWKYRPWQEVLEVRQVIGDLDESGILEKRNFGILVHTLIERSKTKEDFTLELDEMFFEGAINSEEKMHVHQKFESLCLNPQFQSWFDKEQKVLTEQGILLPGGESKRPDRLVYFKDRVEIIDFKTGIAHPSHHSQLHEYIHLVKEIEGIEVLGFICYLENGNVEKVNVK
ncbi:MAG: UvrD-helicase domain-containing protein [Cyclobacteriaceae bacterium]